MRWHRRHQQLFNIALELGAKERRGHVGVGVGNNRHHDQAWHNKLHIGKPVHLANARTNQVTENDKYSVIVMTGGTSGLHPDTHKAVNLFAQMLFSATQ
jgi:hypothetical protein